MGPIQRCISQIKKVKLDEMRELKAKGHKKIKFYLDPKRVENGKDRKAMTASVPLIWIVETKERFEVGHQMDEKVFDSFISDWITGWA